MWPRWAPMSISAKRDAYMGGLWRWNTVVCSWLKQEFRYRWSIQGSAVKRKQAVGGRAGKGKKQSKCWVSLKPPASLWSYKTLQSCLPLRACRTSRRRSGLSQSHHRSVLAIDSHSGAGGECKVPGPRGSWCGEAALSAQRQPSDSQRFKLVTRDGTGAPNRQGNLGRTRWHPTFQSVLGKYHNNSSYYSSNQ